MVFRIQLTMAENTKAYIIKSLLRSLELKKNLSPGYERKNRRELRSPVVPGMYHLQPSFPLSNKQH